VNPLRLWILTSALGCFAAGMTSGLVIPEVLDARADGPEVSGRDADYIARFVQEFQLDARQQRQLRLVCADRRRKELEVLQNAVVDDLPPELQAPIREARRLQTERIRKLLHPDQLARFDAMAQPDRKNR
jgi:hypothetical protein